MSRNYFIIEKTEEGIFLAEGTGRSPENYDSSEFWKDWEDTGNGDVSDEEIAGQRPPLTVEELERLAGKINRLGRRIKIRTHVGGELEYEGNRSRRAACKW